MLTCSINVFSSYESARKASSPFFSSKHEIWRENYATVRTYESRNSAIMNNYKIKSPQMGLFRAKMTTVLKSGGEIPVHLMKFQ